MKKKSSKGRITRVFLGVSMQYQHDGLFKLLSEHKIDPMKIPAGEFIVFINRKMNRVKVLAVRSDTEHGTMPFQVLAYTRLPRGVRMDMNAIQFIPQAFATGTLDYDRALTLAISKALATPSKQREFGLI